MVTERVTEWPTVGLWLVCLGVWALSLWIVAPWSVGLALVLCVLSLVLHASITHEIVHGHPWRNRWASQALVWVNPGLFIPYLRFRDTHLAHHLDARLTDPYDDPESNYLDPDVWRKLSKTQRRLRQFNNTLFGRMLVGPIVGQLDFIRADLSAIRAGDRQVLRGWLHHLPGVALTIGVVWLSEMPIWAYLMSTYLALSILKIRTFLEHQAHTLARGRTVIIEARCPLAFLFLYNSLHVVHHMHPRVPWYRLPKLYEANKARYIKRNDGYVFPSYASIFKAYLFAAKDPVAHPLWRSGQ